MDNLPQITCFLHVPFKTGKLHFYYCHCHIENITKSLQDKHLKILKTLFTLILVYRLEGIYESNQACI